MGDMIGVSSAVLRSASKTISNQNTLLTQNLNECFKQVKYLEATWESEAGADIRTAMKNLKPKFSDYEKVIAAYAKFLENTATNYENMEAAIDKNANLFK